MKEELLPIKSAAERLGLSVSAVRSWVLRRKISYHKVGGAVRIPASEVERILKDGYVPAKKEVA